MCVSPFFAMQGNTKGGSKFPDSPAHVEKAIEWSSDLDILAGHCGISLDVWVSRMNEQDKQHPEGYVYH